VKAAGNSNAQASRERLGADRWRSEYRRYKFRCNTIEMRWGRETCAAPALQSGSVIIFDSLRIRIVRGVIGEGGGLGDG
jgi:hypothetical protein